MPTGLGARAVTTSLVIAWGLAAALAGRPAPVAAQAATKVIGTFTVAGKTTTWKNIYVTRHEDIGQPSQHFLVVLVADRPVAEADQVPGRMQDLAAGGQLRAIRMVWHEGRDGITTTPFHKDASDSGTVTMSGAILDLTRYDEQQLEAQFKSKMLGQNWHFNAFFKGTVAQGPPMKAEEFDAPPPTTKAVTGTDPTSLKRRVGSLGYEWTDEGFMQAVKAPNVEAVQVFLQGGLSANTKDEQGLAALMFASMSCARNAEGYEAITEALLAAGADANVKDQNNSTPLIWAAQACSPRVVGALIKAGGDVNAKANGGASALMMAEVMQRNEVAAIAEAGGGEALEVGRLESTWARSPRRDRTPRRGGHLAAWH